MNEAHQKGGDTFSFNPQFVRVTVKGGILTARLVGPSVGQREAPIITEEVGAVMQRYGRAIRCVVVDLSDVTMLSSMGLGMCIDIRNRAVKLKAPAVLFGLQPDIAQLFKMMRIERLYKIAKNRDDLARLVA